MATGGSSTPMEASTVTAAAVRAPVVQQRSFGSGGGARGARGHGWWVNYRAGKGGRHLQGTYHEHPGPEEANAWNGAVLSGLGSTLCYLDVRLESHAGGGGGSGGNEEEADPSSPPGSSADNSSGSTVHRLVLELASGALPAATENFGALLEADHEGYAGTTLHRIEKGVGILGGLVREAAAGSSPKNPHAPRTKRFRGSCHPSVRMLSSPTAMDVSAERLVLRHTAGVLTMLQPRIGEIDSRFLLLTHDAPHLDGVSVAIGRIVAGVGGGGDGLDVLRGWESTLITSHGIPTNATLRIVGCGLLPPPPEETETEPEEKGGEDLSENDGVSTATTTTSAEPPKMQQQQQQQASGSQ